MNLQNTEKHLAKLQSADDLRRFLRDLGYDAQFDEEYFLPAQTKADVRAQNLLAGELEVVAAHGDFRVFYGRLKNKLSISDERAIVERLLADKNDYALFVFSDASQKNWRFLNVKRDAKSAARRRIFRRFTVDAAQAIGRTTLERLGSLDLSGQKLEPLETQILHESAFDVEAVTRNFYEEYEKIFARVKAQIRPKSGLQFDEIARHDWTQRLFNRLMFLRFLERKGWLLFSGKTDYLNQMWRAADKAGENFLSDRLYWAFFWGLGTPNDAELGEISREELERKRGDVPFLNGGLFTALKTYDDRDCVALDNGISREILDFFDAFNFTISESTPLDVEVAVDPEMLGKVFEELVTNRHGEGAYYTPRPIVSFMGREALKGYLANCGENAGNLARFVDEGDAGALSNPERVLEALKSVTICDPACGSGAYLLGAMQELLRLRQALFVSKQLDALSLYERKLEIISRNLYGVDKSEFAVQIAMLRLWLSLVIDFDGPREEIPALPNLGYKIGVGDSLAAPDPLDFADIFRAPYLIHAAEMGRLHDEYLRHGIDEKAQRPVRPYAEIEAAMTREAKEMRDVAIPLDAGVFNWRLSFAEVLARGGFDIALANPPYVRQELLGADYKRRVLLPAHPDVAGGTADLFVYFYSRALQLLKSGGMLAFISSNKWLRAGYGAKLRAHLSQTTHVQSLTDFGELPVFQTAATFPLICVAQKGAANQTTTFTQVKSLGLPYPDVRELIATSGAALPATALNGSDWQLSNAQTSARLETMRKAGVPLGEYVRGQIFRGVLTGFNEAFVLDELTRLNLVKADKKSAELIKPMAKGDDVRRWRIEDKKRFLIVTKIGVEIKNYPAIFAHLKQWQPQLEKRADQGKFWWELRACAYYSKLEAAKIVFPDIAKEPRFAFDKSTYVSNTTYFLAVEDLFLLGVLNSSALWEFAKSQLTVMGDAEKGGRLRFFTQFVEHIPIPTPSSADRLALETLVSECLALRGAGCESQEIEINARVASLYGL